MLKLRYTEDIKGLKDYAEDIERTGKRYLGVDDFGDCIADYFTRDFYVCKIVEAYKDVIKYIEENELGLTDNNIDTVCLMETTYSFEKVLVLLNALLELSRICGIVPCFNMIEKEMLSVMYKEICSVFRINMRLVKDREKQKKKRNKKKKK